MVPNQPNCLDARPDIVGGGSIARLVDGYLHPRKTTELLAVERGLRFTREHEQSGWEPDLHRLKGELLLQRANAIGGKHLDDIDVAQRCFLNAIERARNNDAKSYELRAAMSLCRLWSKQGKRRDAQRILAEVYGWFTEGKNTPDLVDARRLLNKAPESPLSTVASSLRGSAPSLQVIGK